MSYFAVTLLTKLPASPTLDVNTAHAVTLRFLLLYTPFRVAFDV